MANVPISFDRIENFDQMKSWIRLFKFRAAGPEVWRSVQPTRWVYREISEMRPVVCGGYLLLRLGPSTAEDPGQAHSEVRSGVWYFGDSLVFVACEWRQEYPSVQANGNDRTHVRLSKWFYRVEGRGRGRTFRRVTRNDPAVRRIFDGIRSFETLK